MGQGYRVVLIIDADMLVPFVPYSWEAELNHAVSLLSPISGIPSMVQCTLFTWGKTVRIPETLRDKKALLDAEAHLVAQGKLRAHGNVVPHAPPLDGFGNMTIETFLKYCYGFVAAKY